MNNIFISSAKKDEAVENFVKSKKEELEKMIPGFVDDRKFTDIVLDFYERGIRDGIQMMQERMMKDAIDGDVLHAAAYPNMLKVINTGTLPKGYRFGDKVKIIIVKED